MSRQLYCTSDDFVTSGDVKMTAPKEVRIYAARGFFDSSREDETHFCKMIKLEDHDTEVQALKAEIAVLEARLEKCKEQRDEQVDREFHESQVNERDARVGILNVQLGRITIDSIKRGE